MIADRRRRRRLPGDRVADGRPHPRLPRVRLGLRGAAAIVATLAILGGAYLWLRSSSLVAVRQVTIAGVSGPDAPQIHDSLQTAARGMTTLDVQSGKLHAAVAAYPVVRSLHVSTHFPHGMRIDVFEQVPVAVVQAAGQRTVVSGDGTLLRVGAGGAILPTISLAVAPGATHVTGAARTEVSLLAAAPYRLLARIATAGQAAGRGLTVSLRNGPAVYFGSADQLAAKWGAVTAVLASPTSAGADYIDVTDPGRPAAGTGADTATAPSAGSSSAAGGSSSAATSTAPSTGTPANPGQTVVP